MNHEELRAGSITRRFRGYDRAAVDALLAGASAELQRLTLELARSNDRISELESDLDRLKGKEDSITAAIVSAQEAANDVRQNALRQADAILEDARKRAAQLEADLQERLNALRWDFEKLAIDKQRFVESFRNLLETYLAGLAPEAHQTERPTKNGGPKAPRLPEASIADAVVVVAVSEEPLEDESSERADG